MISFPSPIAARHVFQTWIVRTCHRICWRWFRSSFMKLWFFVNSVPWYKLDGHWLRRFQINQSVIALHSRLYIYYCAIYFGRKVVSAWCMNAISKWRYSLYGRGINIASVTSHEYLTT
jgi:hypothetical protein